MPIDRVASALSRIERAVDRIEARITDAAPAPPPPPAADHALIARHARLRADTAAALARLDRLLGTGDAADGAD